MAKDLTISILLDFYGDMLTEKQREMTELYHNEDLSLGEIASDSGITRQGVRDSIKRAEFQLREYEERLGLAQRFHDIQDTLGQIIQCAKEIEGYNTRFCLSSEISRKCSEIVELAEKLGE